jgi:phage shock protein C
MNVKKLYRSSHDRMLAGVCGGLAEYFNIDPTVVRLLFVLLALVTVGFPMVLAYFILYIIVPRNPGI